MKFDTVKKWVKDCFTENDGATICPVRATAIGGTTYSFGCHAYATFIQHVPFDMLSFSAGLSAILGVLGIAMGTRKDISVPEKKVGE